MKQDVEVSGGQQVTRIDVVDVLYILVFGVVLGAGGTFALLLYDIIRLEPIYPEYYRLMVWPTIDRVFIDRPTANNLEGRPVIVYRHGTPIPILQEVSEGPRNRWRIFLRAYVDVTRIPADASYSIAMNSSKPEWEKFATREDCQQFADTAPLANLPISHGFSIGETVELRHAWWVCEEEP